MTPDPQIPSQPQEDEPEFSLYAQERAVIRQAEEILEKLDDVTRGVRQLAQAYRNGYRETMRLVRISDRMQLDLHDANRTLSLQACELTSLNETLLQEIERREHLERELRRIASVDELTGLHTRRHVLELGEHEYRRLARHQRELAILLIDLDHFKRINDSHGHAAGDEVLRHVGSLFRASLREGDIAGRFGGEEFLAILPETDLPAARQIAERLRTCLDQSVIVWRDIRIRLTLSIGIATTVADEPIERTIARADRALYDAKRSGRNRVQVELANAEGADDWEG